MPTVITALGLGPLKWRDILISAVSPNVGFFNIYNTATAATDLSPTLPHAAALGAAGSIMFLEKDIADTTSHAVIFNCFAGEHFTDGSTSKTIFYGGQSCLLMTVDVNGVIKWKVWGDVGGLIQSIIEVSGAMTLPDPGGLDVIAIVDDGVPVTLPTAVGSRNKYTIKSLGIVTVGTTSAQTIDGSALPVTIASGDSIDLIPVSGNWIII